MFIINRYNIFHSYPDGQPLPVGARVATATEVADWQKQEDANKPVLRQKKREAAAQRAQLVVVSEQETSGPARKDGK